MEHHDHHEHHPHQEALEPIKAQLTHETGAVYTCPMHPQIRQNAPGSCPLCGMALEPLMPSLDDDNPELRDFSRRFWWTLPFTVVVFVLAMGGHQLRFMDPSIQSWVELVLTLPVVLWAAWPDAGIESPQPDLSSH